MLSIVVGARHGESPPARCLAALAPQVGPGVEVILVEDGDGGDHPDWVRRIERPGALVPQLWAEGIHRARGRVIALTAGTLVPDADWVTGVLRDHESGAAVVGGSVDPAADLDPVGWAVFLVRYAAFMPPLPTGDVEEVPGDNASYDAEVLRRYRGLYEDGFWEPFVHRAMRDDGHRIVRSSGRPVRYTRGSLGMLSFSRQRISHGIHHGARLTRDLRRTERLLRVAAAPLVPVVMTARVLAHARRRPRDAGRVLMASPFVLWFTACWAAGEALGMLRASREGAA